MITYFFNVSFDINIDDVVDVAEEFDLFVIPEVDVIDGNRVVVYHCGFPEDLDADHIREFGVRLADKLGINAEPINWQICDENDN